MWLDMWLDMAQITIMCCRSPCSSCACMLDSSSFLGRTWHSVIQIVCASCDKAACDYASPTVS